jgi:hypothetical protein
MNDAAVKLAQVVSDAEGLGYLDPKYAQVMHVQLLAVLREAHPSTRRADGNDPDRLSTLARVISPYDAWELDNTALAVAAEVLELFVEHPELVPPSASAYHRASALREAADEFLSIGCQYRDAETIEFLRGRADVLDFGATA